MRKVAELRISRVVLLHDLREGVLVGLLTLMLEELREGYHVLGLLERLRLENTMVFMTWPLLGLRGERVFSPSQCFRNHLLEERFIIYASVGADKGLIHPVASPEFIVRVERELVVTLGQPGKLRDMVCFLESMKAFEYNVLHLEFALHILDADVLHGVNVLLWLVRVEVIALRGELVVVGVASKKRVSCRRLGTHVLLNGVR